jgi:adenylylsulfate kinase-like enzyme
MLNKLWNWAIKSEWLEKEWVWSFPEKTTKGLPVLWLHGPAGAGKSAIMCTFAEQLANAG